MESEDSFFIKHEVQEIRKALCALESRLTTVENRIHSSTDLVATATPIIPSAPSTIAQANNAFALSKETVEEGSKKIVEPIVQLETSINSEALEQRPKETFEARFGQYWLNKIGVASLVLGIVFLILYSFQYFGAPLKLLTGITIAAGLIIFGDKLAKDKKMRWYGNGLMSGGWALGYFTVYAMYFIRDLQVIYSSTVELTLLLAVCAAAIIHAMSCDAEVIAVFAVTLANLSIYISGPSLDSNIPVFLIAAIVSFAAFQKRWYKLLIWLIPTSYITHIVASDSVYEPLTQVPFNEGLRGLIYLAMFWLTFNVGMLFAKENEAWQKTTITIASCLNALACLTCIELLTEHVFVDQRFLFLCAIGACYLGTGPLLRRSGLKQLTTVNLLIGLSFVNLALSMHYTGPSISVVCLCEFALLATVGTRYNIRAFRWFAILLALAFFLLWLCNCQPDPYSQSIGLVSISTASIGLLAVIVFGDACWLYRKKDPKSEGFSPERLYYRNFYFVLANSAAFFVACTFNDHIWAAVAWTIQAIACACLSLELTETFFAIVSFLLAIPISATLIISLSSWQWPPMLIIVTAFYASYFYCYKRGQVSNEDPGFQNLRTSFQFCSALMGTIILTILFLLKLSSLWLSAGLALEGLALVTIGFAMKERMFRISGLSVLALLVCKLLFVDLAQADTLQRIVSFIVAGAVFLIASYAYSRFAASQTTKS